MCTAISLTPSDHYFGRTMDLAPPLEGRILILPRNCPISFCRRRSLDRHYAILGMGRQEEGCPLYYEAMNEGGLAVAALNFPGWAQYGTGEGEEEIAPFELIPWLLGQCASVGDAVALLRRTRLTEEPFSSRVPLTPLHFLLSDRERSLVLEPVESGLRLHEAPAGVLTNSPDYDWQMTHLRTFLPLDPEEPRPGRLARQLKLTALSRGLGSFGLPGELSSPARLVRAAYFSAASRWPEKEEGRVSHMFHLLAACSLPMGSVRSPEGEWDYTQYTSCMNVSRGICYYKWYDKLSPRQVDLFKADLEDSRLLETEGD